MIVVYMLMKTSQKYWRLTNKNDSIRKESQYRQEKLAAKSCTLEKSVPSASNGRNRENKVKR